MATYVIGITGASGAPYARQVLRGLLEKENYVKLIVSPAGERVVAIELGLQMKGSRKAREEQWAEYLDIGKGSLELLAHKDFAASIASGSYPFDGMAVVPCSMGTVGRIAHGLSTNLIERAADVALKEKRRLVIVPRETPLNLIHLRNLTTLAEAGAEILPAMPGFYHLPKSVDELVESVAGRVLDRIGVQTDMFKKWRGDPLEQLAQIDE